MQILFFCLCVCSFVKPLRGRCSLARTSLTRGRSEKRTPHTNRPGNRGAFEPGDHLSALYGPAAFQLAFGVEERSRADVSELLHSGRGLSTRGRKETS